MIGFLTHSHHTQPPHSATHSHTQPSHSCHTRPHTATQSPHTSTTLNHSPWRRRVLVLVEIIPDSGEVRGVHVSALDKGRKKWYTISGWEGFGHVMMVTSQILSHFCELLRVRAHQPMVHQLHSFVAFPGSSGPKASMTSMTTPGCP